MTVFVIWTWVVKPEKQEEHNRMMQRYLKYIKENPEISRVVKSMKVFTQTFGGIYGSYVQLIEYNSLADYERLQGRLLKDKEYMEILQEFMLVIDPAKLSVNVWNAVT